MGADFIVFVQSRLSQLSHIILSRIVSKDVRVSACVRVHLTGTAHKLIRNTRGGGTIIWGPDFGGFLTIGICFTIDRVIFSFPQSKCV